MRIEEEYMKTGYFWLPEKEDKKIPGTMRICDGGEIELEVVGLFDESIKSLKNDDDLSRIIGHVEKDGLVTLENCFYTQKNFGFGAISKSKIHVNKVLSGVAYDRDEAVEFNPLSFSVDCFDEWVGISGIDVENNWEKKTATITYKPPKNITYLLDNGMRLEICFAYTFPGFPKTNEAKITQRAYFRLTSDELIPLDYFTEIAYKLTNLLCFAIDSTVTMKDVIASSSKIQRHIVDGKTRLVPIRVYYPSIPFVEKVPHKSWHQMLFNYGAIKSNAQMVFNNWINAYEIIAPALSLYFSTKTGAQKYIDGKFLALAQGLETYHRRTSDEKLMDSGKFDSLVSTILDKCPEEHLDFIKGRLMHGNEINLGKRLKRIIEPFRDHLGNGRARNEILRKIVDTRNYLTHYSEDLKDKAASGIELWYLCQKMEAIFQLHFLKVIGFNDLEINRVVENCNPLKNKLSQKQKPVSN